MRPGDCPFPGCSSTADHDLYDTHIRCLCGWVGVRHSSHQAGMTNVGQKFRYNRSPSTNPASHKIAARQRLRRPVLRAVS